jgi:hypothetical protein
MMVTGGHEVVAAPPGTGPQLPRPYGGCRVGYPKETASVCY